jgi:lipopolysaccharide export system ATP-binding protein
MTVLLAAECVGKSFGGRRVLTSASLRAVPGETRALLGRNGSGKSTLLRIAAGCMAPDTGTVQWDGTVSASHRLASLARRGVFFLPDHDLLSNAFTVGRQLEMLHARYGGTAPGKAAAQMGIASHVDRRPAALSGGERRRAELAAVMVRRPRCLLADEPLRGLAPIDAEALARTFRELAAGGVAVVITGHEVAMLVAAADHLTWCTSGTTYELGPIAEAMTDERFRREYLGP